MGRIVEADVCVVGAGPAGAIVASKLAASGKRVMLVEQGARYDMNARSELLKQRNHRLLGELGVDFGDDWPGAFKNADVSNRGAEQYKYSFVSGVGGSSLHWSANTPRPLVQDMRVRTLYRYGRDWPISYDELEPWLLRAEGELGVSANDDNPYDSRRSGPFPMPAHPFSYFEREIFAPAARRLGWTAHSRPNAINSVARDGRSACLSCRACSLCPSGARYSADQVHVARFLRAQPDHLLSATKLVRLELSRDGRRVAFAHAMQMPRVSDRPDVSRARPAHAAKLAIRAGVYVLAMGGIETPRMLLLTRDHKRHPAGLGNAGGQLGRRFTDHLMNLFWMQLREPVGGALGFPVMGCDHFRPLARREHHGSFFITLFPSPNEWDYAPSAMFSKSAMRGDTLSLAAMREAYARGIVGFTMHEMSADHTLDLDPEQRDEFGNALPRVSAKLTDWDRAGVNRVRTLVQGKLGDALGAEASGDHWELGWGPVFAAHPSGATAMARTPDHGVCDTNLQTFGVENLYLASASVFPHQGANNPTLTTVALALRLANHLGAA